jgi:hypothetical protein
MADRVCSRVEFLDGVAPLAGPRDGKQSPLLRDDDRAPCRRCSNLRRAVTSLLPYLDISHHTEYNSPLYMSLRPIYIYLPFIQRQK